MSDPATNYPVRFRDTDGVEKIWHGTLAEFASEHPGATILAPASQFDNPGLTPEAADAAMAQSQVGDAAKAAAEAADRAEAEAETAAKAASRAEAAAEADADARAADADAKTTTADDDARDDDAPKTRAGQKKAT